MMKTVNVGIIGGGLMGREVASAFARWCVMKDMPVQPVLAGVADVNAGVLDWFRGIPSANNPVLPYSCLKRIPIFHRWPSCE